ncbi:hypothetical protein BDZ88DRAFT_455550 [Geranomyces variabilis]|nr:hypothetical protein BDZ88DRAFT_455550 [Geranomyces variabilis]
MSDSDDFASADEAIEEQRPLLRPSNASKRKSRAWEWTDNPIDQAALDAYKATNVPANTIRSTEQWAAKWESYVIAKEGKGADDMCEEAILADHLEAFIHGLRKDNGCNYKDSTLKVGFAALARHIKKRRKLDLHNDNIFAGVSTVLDRRCKDLQDAGCGGTNHSGSISIDELYKILSSDLCNRNTPRGLINRVYLQVAYFLANRGGDTYRAELQHLQKKTTSDGRFYYEYARGREKNHQQGVKGVEAGQLQPTMVIPGCQHSPPTRLPAVGIDTVARHITPHSLRASAV